MTIAEHLADGDSHRRDLDLMRRAPVYQIMRRQWEIVIATGALTLRCLCDDDDADCEWVEWL